MSNTTVPADVLAAVIAAPPHRHAAIRAAAASDAPRPTPSADAPLLLTVKQAAALLGLSRSSIWRAIRAKRLKKVAVYTGCERLRRADVEALAGGAS